jgi:hypothetical protein
MTQSLTDPHPHRPIKQSSPAPAVPAFPADEAHAGWKMPDQTMPPTLKMPASER